MTKTEIKRRIKAKQEGGDDGYCWAIRIDGSLFVNGLTRAEVPYYKQQAINHMNRLREKERQREESKSKGTEGPTLYDGLD